MKTLPSLLVLALCAFPTEAAAQWAGLVDRSDDLGTDTFQFTGTSGDRLNPHGNENYYDGDFADLDGDRLPDRVLGSRYGMLFNTGGGAMTYMAGRTGFLFRGMAGAAGWGEDMFQTADVDGDGDYDVWSGGNGEPLVLQVNRAFRFSVAASRTTRASAILMVLIDIERDGDVDVVIDDEGFTYNFALWVNNGSGTFTEETTARGLGAYAGVSGVSGIVAGDVDGDGDYDLVVQPAERYATGVEKVFHVMLNDGSGRFTRASTFSFAEHFMACCPIGGFAQALNLGDVDDDGDLDLAVARGAGAAGRGAHPQVSHSLFMNDGSGRFTDESAARWDTGGFDPTGVYAGNKIGGGDGKLIDIDYDGDLDFVAHSKANGRIPIFLNDGTGRFVYDAVHSPTYPATMGLGADCDITDLDGDGSYDVWLGNGGGRVRIFLNLYADPAGVPADVPRSLRVVSSDATGNRISWQAPPFASTARFYRVYRSTAPGVAARDRTLLRTVGDPHQDETFAAAITRHTTTAYLGESDVTLDGTTETVTILDRTALAGITYWYTVSHVGSETQESAPAPEVAATMPPAGGADTVRPHIVIVGPTDQDWSRYPRIVIETADGGSGIDESSLHISFDRPLGGAMRAAGANLADLAYRHDDGVFIAALEPPLSLPSDSLVTLTARVDDLAGNRSTATVTFYAGVDPAMLPVARLTATGASGDAPLAVRFDGSASSDPDGTLWRWEWYFGDGETGLGREISHTFDVPGSYTVRLLVRDNDGGVASATTLVTVTGMPPLDAGPGCTPDCSGRSCGDDGCGGSCGDCPAGTLCGGGGACLCAGALVDCGGSCVDIRIDPGHCGDCDRACAAGQSCAAGECSDRPGCVPDCRGRTCGDDSCGGTCGACGEGEICASGGRCSRDGTDPGPGPGPGPGADGGCGCGVAPGGVASSALAALALLAFSFVCRRRRRV